MRIIKSVNILAPVIYVLALYCGITGKADWWVIGLILASHVSIDLKLK